MENYLELSKNEEDRANELIEKCLFIDVSQATHQYEFDEDFLEKMDKSGLDCVHITLNPPVLDISAAIKVICDWNNVIYNLGEERIIIATKHDDVINAKKEGKKAIILGLQDQPIGDDLRLLEILRLCRVMIFQLTYNSRNRIADGCNESSNAKLSDFGVRVIEELNRLGMIIDLSHVGIASTMDAMEISRGPVIFSHSGVRSINENSRCINDEQIKALAEKNGMIGIFGINEFIVPNAIELGATIEDYLNHITYIEELVGVDYVGIGTDIRAFPKRAAERSRRIVRREFIDKSPSLINMDAQNKYPRGMIKIEEFGNITRGLVSRGYSDEEISKILGKNFLRVFKEICG